MDHGVPLDMAELPLLLEIEQPLAGAVVTAGSLLRGYGWALCGVPILSITCWLDDVRLCQMVRGLIRSDISEDFAHYPDHDTAGFSFTATLPPRAPGPARLVVKVQTVGAEHLHVIPVEVAGTAAGEIAGGSALPGRRADAPPAELLCLEVEQALIEPGGIVTVRGWALGMGEIETVEVLLGDRWLGFAETGKFRQDLVDSHGAYPNALTAGFALSLQVDPTQVAEAVDRLVSVIVTDRQGSTRSVMLPLRTPATRMMVGAIAVPSAMLAFLDEARITDRGVLRVRGWAVCLSAIEHVSVYLDDVPVGQAEAGLLRDDVALAHAEYPDARMSGFLLQRILTDEELAVSSERAVRVVIGAVGGIRRELHGRLAAAPNARSVSRDRQLHFHCDDITLDEAGAFAIKGWAVCATGIETMSFQIGELDAGSCGVGGDRPDVGNHFPEIPGARSGGFRYARALGQAFSGEQIVRIVLRGRDGTERVVLQPVLAHTAQGGAGDVTIGGGDDAPIRWFLESPTVAGGHASETVRGFLSVNGWAFARAGIASIEVFVDGQSQGRAYHGIRREDLEATFPGRNALLSGFAQIIPPQALKRGLHEVGVVVTDRAGHVARSDFTIEAEPATEGPGPWQLRTKLTQAEVDLQMSLLGAQKCRPNGSRVAFCLVMPLTRTLPADLQRARDTLASLRHHAYPDWRLVIALPMTLSGAVLGASPDGFSRDGMAAALLAGFEDLAPQVEVVVLPPETRLADLVTGPKEGHPGLLCLLAAGDLLGEDALLELALEQAVQGGAADFLYSDERRVDPADHMMKAFFKPDWSPDLLLTTNYIGRLWAATPELLRACDLRLGGLARDGDYDAVLRLTERATRIRHVPRVLAARGCGRQDSKAMERRALQRALRRREIAGEVLAGCLPGSWRCRRDVVVSGRISIIIPTIASRGLVQTTIESIRAHTAWPDIEIVVLDNIPRDADAEGQGWKLWLRQNADRVVEIRERFNWSRFNNRGARKATGEFLLFLNDDIEILDDTWLHGLMEHAQRPEVGIVGPQLLYPDGRVQHAGVFLSREVGRHAYRFYPRDAPGAFGLALSQRNVISVTGACMLVRREAFDRLGGFDEAHAVINNDLDFALRAHAAGLLTIYTPHVTMIHHEMVSRYKMKDTYNSKVFDAAWKDRFLQGDPYFNPNLTSDYDDYPQETEPLRQLLVGHPIAAASGVKRILAIKVDHIGDFIAAFPAFRRLKEHFPNAELTVLAARASLSLAQMEPAIDRVIEYNFFHARSERGHRAAAEKELLALEETLAPYRFDLAVDLRRQPDTRHLLRLAGARWLAGFEQHNDMKWLDIAVEWEGDIARSNKRTHVTDSLLQFVDAIGTACATDRRVIGNPQLASDARQALAALPAVRPMAAGLFARPIVCIHTGAGAINKQWPAASFAGLIDLLVAGCDVNVMVIGGPDEAEFASQVLALVRRPAADIGGVIGARVFSLVGKTGLRDLPTALLSAALYVGNDSGPKHMAASLGVPTIGIHSGTVDAGEWGPMGPHAVALRREMSCSPCYLALASDCHRGLACLYGIKVGDVFRACQRMLLLGQVPLAPDLAAD